MIADFQIQSGQKLVGSCYDASFGCAYFHNS